VPAARSGVEPLRKARERAVMGHHATRGVKGCAGERGAEAAIVEAARAANGLEELQEEIAERWERRLLSRRMTGNNQLMAASRPLWTHLSPTKVLNIINDNKNNNNNNTTIICVNSRNSSYSYSTANFGESKPSLCFNLSYLFFQYFFSILLLLLQWTVIMCMRSACRGHGQVNY